MSAVKVKQPENSVAMVAHSISVRSLGYRRPSSLYFSRSSAVHMLISLQGYQKPTTKFSQTGSHSRHFYNQLILLWHSGPYRKSATAGLSCFNGMTSSAVARGYDVVLGACLSL